MKLRCISNKLVSSTDIWEFEKGFEGELTFISLYTLGKIVEFVKYPFHRIWKQNVTVAGKKKILSADRKCQIVKPWKDLASIL